MKFIIQKDYLVQSVQDVMKAVSSRTTIPILTGIKIVATEEGVTLTGSDSDISIESFIPNEEEGKEIVALHAHIVFYSRDKLFTLRALSLQYVTPASRKDLPIKLLERAC